ncbi:type II toxin-antitoxin system RelE/ParE family toxin [Candidatus Bathyarchaeota archaeon]|nr:type II toxin-antitoxin system RelE/ParE family toxin [Candidatus Bathyarchaeota archaeon]
MSFEVYLHPKADSFLKNLNSRTKERIKNHLRELVEEPDKKGKPLDPSQFLSMRIGDYRAIYEIIWDESKVNVLFIGHRDQVYANFERVFL